MGLAYLLWLGCGLFGAHRFYLGHRVSAAAMAAITLVSLALAQSGLGLLGFAATGAWALADLLLIPEMVRDCNETPGAAAPKQAPTAAVA